MAITVEKANAYFKTHVSGGIWAPLDEDTKNAAIAHAIRLGKRLLYDSTDWDDSDTDDDDHPRYDAGTYEQALYLIMRGPQLRQGGSLPLQLATDPAEEDNTKRPDKSIYSPEALRFWTGGGQGAYMVRLARG